MYGRVRYDRSPLSGSLRNSSISFDDPRMPPLALLLLDYQSEIRNFVPDKTIFDAAVSNGAELLAVARAQGPEKVVIAHVIVGGLRRSNEELYSVVKESKFGNWIESFPASLENPGIVESVTPLPGEKVHPRPRGSPFHDTDFNSFLRSKEVTRLILAGVATSGAVLHTWRSALDADYEVEVVPQACADLNPEMHQILVEKFFNRFGEVLSVEEAKKQLAA
ncbi:Isochorismatase hydrolase [Dacryopinax primogenitus]|uniref:Isochorismatase hydrolase n=1 Tax=Dacryopinax primogenitus (strain DJM 731) TaxID=1858805 RepID=M5G4T9_DACPD|nr:Isochorismatase hydrolase [Dacryopinax primogenitus]EJT98757.1 Isochorismatase hydrolase [Dacryopinax primogenitus]